MKGYTYPKLIKILNKMTDLGDPDNSSEPLSCVGTEQGPETLFCELESGTSHYTRHLKSIYRKSSKSLKGRESLNDSKILVFIYN